MAKEVYVTEPLGPKQAQTPEGYLYCREVPVARTGIMAYGPYELQDDSGQLLDPGRDGLIYVHRDADEIFNQRTMSSFEGKPVTVHHPAIIDQLVNAGNWSSVARGISQNVRRGQGDQSHLLLADLLVTSQDAIDLVRSKELREVSLGYVASYEQERPGLAKQTNIIGNHIALVPKGRCGNVCSIGDSEMTLAESNRKETLRRAFNTRDAALFARALDDWGDDDHKADAPEPNNKETSSGFEKNGDGGGNGFPKPKDGGAGASGSGATHHVTVNVHGVGGGTPGATLDPSDASTGSGPTGGATREGVDPSNPDAVAPGGDPGAGDDPVELIMAALKKLDARLSALEQAMGGGGAQPQAQPQPKPQGPPGGQRTGDNAADDKGATNFGEPGKERPDDPSTQKPVATEDDDEDDDGESATSDDESGKGPSGAPGAELKKNLVTKGSSEGGDGGAQQENKNAPELRKEPDSPGDKGGQDPLPKKITGDKMYVPNPMDATRRREEWANTISKAELLMPGVRLPTFDAALDEKQIGDVLCTFKRRVLAASFETARGEPVIRPFVSTTDSPDFSKMPCGEIEILFRAASEKMRENANVMNVSRGPAITKDKGVVPKTPAEINAFNREYYARIERGGV